jgi:hypothetical protein
MTARVIDIADYRRRKQEAAKPVSRPSAPAALTLWPMFCLYGWFLVPMMVPVTVPVSSDGAVCV